LRLKLERVVFKTDPNEIHFGIGVFNDEYSPLGDMLQISSYINDSDSNPPNGYIVDAIDWFLYDPSGTASSSDDLPTTALVLSDWNQSAYGLGLVLLGKNPSNHYAFSIQAFVTKATKSRERDMYFTT